MPNYYVYLISSLPVLIFNGQPPFSFESFLQLCRGLIPDRDIEIIKITSEKPGYIYKGKQTVLKGWFSFETALRNEFVKIRASHRHIDPAPYLRQDGYTGPSLFHAVMSAHRNPSLLESERALDQERWNFLEELERGHYFDIDFLIVYAFKLLILERWERINAADKIRLMEGVLAKIVK